MLLAWSGQALAAPGDGIVFRRDNIDSGGTAYPAIWYLAGGVPIQLTENLRFHEADETPAWSPDGATLAINRNTSDVYSIWTLDLSTEAVSQMTDDGAADDDPAWNHDGSEIAFTSQTRHEHQMVYMERGRCQWGPHADHG
jgi:Tol biopolymer transport system component